MIDLDKTQIHHIYLDSVFIISLDLLIRFI